MKPKQEHIIFWLKQADDDWSAVGTLFHGKKYLQCLFFAHLVIEKICKALWVRDNPENIPPRTHNLLLLISLTTVELDDQQKEFLLNLNRFQLEGRYPDYYAVMHSVCNESFTEEMLESTNEMRLWLLRQVH